MGRSRGCAKGSHLSGGVCACACHSRHTCAHVWVGQTSGSPEWGRAVCARHTPPAAAVIPVCVHHTTPVRARLTSACPPHQRAPLTSDQRGLITSYRCVPIPTARTHHITPRVSAHHTIPARPSHHSGVCPSHQPVPIPTARTCLTSACPSHHTSVSLAPHQCVVITPVCARLTSVNPPHHPSVPLTPHQCVLIAPVCAHHASVGSLHRSVPIPTARTHHFTRHLCAHHTSVSLTPHQCVPTTPVCTHPTPPVCSHSMSPACAHPSTPSVHMKPRVGSCPVGDRQGWTMSPAAATPRADPGSFLPQAPGTLLPQKPKDRHAMTLAGTAWDHAWGWGTAWLARPHVPNPGTYLMLGTPSLSGAPSKPPQG